MGRHHHRFWRYFNDHALPRHCYNHCDPVMWKLFLSQILHSSNVPQVGSTVLQYKTLVCSPLSVETLHGFLWRFRAQETLDISQTPEKLGSPA